MAISMNRPDPRARRREPSQKRSRERVERILAATRDLLEEQGLAAITTTRIAVRAGLPVGSIYQYFPDKSAIFCSMYAEYLHRIRQVMLDWERDGPYGAGWQEFFSQLHRRLKRAEARGNLGTLLLAASRNHPELEALDTGHADVLAECSSRMLRRFGSRWPGAKLRRLSLFIYRLNSASLVHRQLHQSRAKESQDWGETAIMALLGSCLPGQAGSRCAR
jgi:AcrR family transcriptional regulator